jgi:hypothetical protein
MGIRQTQHRPFQPETWLSPNDLGAAGRFRFKRRRIAVIDVCISVPVLVDVNPGGAGAADPATTNAIFSQRIQQHTKLTSVVFGRRYTIQSDLVFEFAKFDSRIDDRRAESEHTELIQVFAAVVADFDNIPLTKRDVAVGFLVVLVLGMRASRIDHGVPGRRRNLQRAAGLCLGKLISAHAGASSSPSSEKFPYG